MVHYFVIPILVRTWVVTKLTGVPDAVVRPHLVWHLSVGLGRRLNHLARE